jgi:hypothetical protein
MCHCGRRSHLCRNGRLFPPNDLHDGWRDDLYRNTERGPKHDPENACPGL